MTVCAALSWSTAGLFPHMVSTDLPTTLFWRSLLGGASVALFFVFRQRTKGFLYFFQLTRSEWMIAVCGTISMLAFISAFYFASVADVVFCYSIFPIVTILLSAILLKTRVLRLDLWCALGVVFGVIIILWGQNSTQNIFGVALSLLATATFALVGVLIQRYPGVQMSKVTYASAALAALVVLPFASVTNTSSADLAWLWLYGVTNIGIGFGLYLLGSKLLKPVMVSLICMIEIPISPLWAYWLLGQVVSTQSLVGGAMVMVAVIANLAWPILRAKKIQQP